MAYDFVIREDKVEQLHTDLTDASTTITGQIEDIYTKIEGLNADWDGDIYQAFVANSETYRIPLQNLVAVIDDFADLIADYGTDGATLITEVSKLLCVDERGVSNTSKGLQDTSSERAKDSSGAYIPPSGGHSESIAIPTDTTLDKGEDCTEIGNAIYQETIKAGEVMNSEITYLEALKTTYMADIMALPPAQRDVALNYLNAEIVARKNVVSQIETATFGDFWQSDGAIFNATSNSETGNMVLGVGVSDQDAVNSSVAAAKKINNSLSDLSSLGSIEAYLADCGIGQNWVNIWKNLIMMALIQK